jgi:hypothetical protein
VSTELRYRPTDPAMVPVVALVTNTPLPLKTWTFTPPIPFVVAASIITPDIRRSATSVKWAVAPLVLAIVTSVPEEGVQTGVHGMLSNTSFT